MVTNQYLLSEKSPGNKKQTFVANKVFLECLSRILSIKNVNYALASGTQLVSISHAPKGRPFDSQSAHIPRFRGLSLIGVRLGGNRLMVLSYIDVSLPTPTSGPKINFKIILKKCRLFLCLSTLRKTLQLPRSVPFHILYCLPENS